MKNFIINFLQSGENMFAFMFGGMIAALPITLIYGQFIYDAWFVLISIISFIWAIYIIYINFKKDYLKFLEENAKNFDDSV